MGANAYLLQQTLPINHQGSNALTELYVNECTNLQSNEACGSLVALRYN